MSCFLRARAYLTQRAELASRSPGLARSWATFLDRAGLSSWRTKGEELGCGRTHRVVGPPRLGGRWIGLDGDRLADAADPGAARANRGRDPQAGAALRRIHHRR